MNVFIVAAITADGFIGRHHTHNTDWSSREDKQLYVQLTKQAGTMVMGSRTFDTIGRALPGRETIIITSRPEQYAGIEHVEATSEDPRQLVQRLAAAGQEQLAICGGASIYHLFMQAGLVDELYLTVEPICFGTGLGLFGQELAARLTLLETRKLNDNTVLLHYRVASSDSETVSAPSVSS